ncbi:MAG: hypothetical protein ACO3UU_13395, partial [Minisyncoccia bacterium]
VTKVSTLETGQSTLTTSVNTLQLVQKQNIISYPLDTWTGYDQYTNVDINGSIPQGPATGKYLQFTSAYQNKHLTQKEFIAIDKSKIYKAKFWIKPVGIPRSIYFNLRKYYGEFDSTIIGTGTFKTISYAQHNTKYGTNWGSWELEFKPNEFIWYSLSGTEQLGGHRLIDFKDLKVQTVSQTTVGSITELSQLAIGNYGYVWSWIPLSQEVRYDTNICVFGGPAADTGSPDRILTIRHKISLQNLEYFCMYITKGDGYWGEVPESGDYIVVEWSVDGTNWYSYAPQTTSGVSISYSSLVSNVSSGSWTKMRFLVPAAQSLGTDQVYIRVRQVSFSGSIYDSWAISEPFVDSATFAKYFKPQFYDLTTLDSSTETGSWQIAGFTLSDVTNINAAVQEEATIRQEETGDLFAQYTVKIDTNG